METKKVKLSSSMIIKFILLALIAYTALSLVVTSLWGKEWILLRNGITLSDVIYESYPESASRGAVFILYKKDMEYGMIEAYPSMRLHLFGSSSYRYAFHAESGVVTHSERYEPVNDGTCDYDANHGNIGVKTRTGNDTAGNRLYTYFVAVSPDQDIYQDADYHFKYKVDDRTIYFFRAVDKFEEVPCMHVKFI